CWTAINSKITRRAFSGEIKRAASAAGIAPIIGPRSGTRLSNPAIKPSSTARSTFNTSSTTVHKIPTMMDISSWPLIYLPATLLILSKIFVA
ncbi:unnamed protein product, partial [marine sediment metagenome]